MIITSDYGSFPKIPYVLAPVSGSYPPFASSYLVPLPILDTLQKMTNSLLVNVDIPIPKD